MKHDFILASGSEIRARLLRAAGLEIVVQPARIDERALERALREKGATPRDIAGALAEAKARAVVGERAEALVLGCDQVAALGDEILTKPADPADARAQLRRLSGQSHSLFSAATLLHRGQVVWHHVGQVRMTMHDLSDAYIENYVARNWRSIRQAVGCYKLEEEGVRLFSAVEGDYFHVLGLPMIELLSYLRHRGEIER